MVVDPYATHLVAPPMTVAHLLQRLDGRLGDEIIVEYSKWIRDKTPDRYGYEIPLIESWRRHKTEEVASLVRRLAKIGEEMNG